MIKYINFLFSLILIFSSVFLHGGELVTIVVTNNASADGSAFVAQFNSKSNSVSKSDLFQKRLPHVPGAITEVYSESGEIIGEIPQLNGTFQILVNTNEHLLTITGHNFSAKEELRDKNGLLDGKNIERIALQRSANARDAINNIASLAEKHGYNDDGYRLFIADPMEVWIMEMVGKGEMNRGVAWVARLIPDGQMAIHGIEPAIGTFPISNRNRDVLYCQDLIAFAREMGYFDGRNRDFNFKDAYAIGITDEQNIKSVRKSGGEFNPTLFKDNDSIAVPLFFQPTQKVSIKTLKDLILVFNIDSCSHLVGAERQSITFIAQMRNWLPKPVGGVVWIWSGIDTIGHFQPYFTGINKFPDTNYEKFENMLKINNLISNTTDSIHIKLKDVTILIRSELENKFHRFAPAIDQTARALFDSNPALAVEFLTDYCFSQSWIASNRWKELLEEIRNLQGVCDVTTSQTPQNP